MGSVNLPFNAGQASGIEELTGSPPMAINVLTDAGGALYTRPGLVEWDEWSCPDCEDADAGPIIGGKVWPSPSGEILVYVTEDTDGVRKLWAMLGPNNRIALSDSTAATQLDGTLRPTFAATKTRIVIAGGGAPQKWEGTGLSSRLGGSPPNLSHVVANATRLAGSAPTVGGFEFWSNPGETGHEIWDTGLDFAEAEARPDIIVATHENSNEVFAFGAETLQVFVPDPDTGYAPSRASNFGCAAPYSVVRAGESFLLLASDEAGRAFAMTDGRGLNPLSEPDMTKTLDRFREVSDCWGFRVRIDAWDLAVWAFPTEGRTLVYESVTKQWSEWRSRENGGWVPWVGTCHIGWQTRNLDLIGLPDGTLALLDPDTFQDDGEELVGLVRTGFIDRGNKDTKTCQRIALTLRLNGTSSLRVRWRDKLGAFCQPLTFSLGLNGDVSPTVEKWTLGQYKSRQWEMEFSANSRLVLAAAEETYLEA